MNLFESSNKLNKFLQKFDGGSDFDKSKFKQIDVSGTFMQADLDQGEIELRLEKKSRILFKTGPCSTLEWAKISIVGYENKFLEKIQPGMTDWHVIEFSNKSLPPEFTVRFSDNGKDFGQWLAVGIPKN